MCHQIVRVYKRSKKDRLLEHEDEEEFQNCGLNCDNYTTERIPRKGKCPECKKNPPDSSSSSD